MYYPLEEIDALGERLRTRLVHIGVRGTRQLLERGADVAGRASLARATGATEAEILEAVQMADLMRVRGAGGNYAALMLAAGVSSAPALARAEAVRLMGALATAKAKVRRVRRLPTLAQVRSWIVDAGALQPIVT